MIIQSVIFKSQIGIDEKLLFYKEGIIKNEESSILLLSNAIVKTNTYLNIFDCGTWNKYTGIEKWKLVFYAKGEGYITLISQRKSEEIEIEKIYVNCKYNKKFEIFFIYEKKECIFCKIEAADKLLIKEMTFQTQNELNYELKKINISIIICTYKRKKEIENNLRMLMHTRFFDKASQLFGKMSIIIIDNASELIEIDNKYLHLIHNENTGGSGGFLKGMEEARRREKQYMISHVILMDDDVEFIPETFYRLYALLFNLNSKYSSSVIAGRMFRKDEKAIQYTAAEIWNKGEILHCGFNVDMSQVQNFYYINDNQGAEYSGWWFACYSMNFIRENNPESYFIHCDDVEYGLRHGGTPLILNGIQVWHETYEYRQTPIIAYYDTRNSLAVNEKYKFFNKEQYELYLLQWKKNISVAHVNKEYLKEYMIILGLFHFLISKYGTRIKNQANFHRKLINIKTSKYKNAIMWRITQRMYRKKYL